jgi:hypothetical protein
MFQQASWVIVQRDKNDILASHRKRNGDERKVQQLIRSALLALALIRHNTGLQWRDVRPQKMINGDFTEIKRVIKWLGLPWNKEAVKEFVDPALWHHGSAWSRAE